MAKLIKWELRVIVWILVVMLITIVLGIYYGHKQDTKGLHIPFTSNDIENEKETTIQIILEDSGFKNIVVDFEETDSSEKDGYIKSFTVGNSTSFTADDYYPDDVRIRIITYKLSGD